LASRARVLTTPVALAGEGGQDLDVVLRGRDNLHLLGALGLALHAHLLALQLGIPFLLVVLLDPLEEALVAAGLAQVRDVHVQPLPELAVPDNLGDLNAEGVAVHVEDNTCAAVVEGEGHAALHGRVDDDVDVVAALEGGHVPRGSWHALRPVLLGELVARAMAVTPRDGVQLAHGELRR